MMPKTALNRAFVPYISAKKPGGEEFQKYKGRTELKSGVVYTVRIGLRANGTIEYYLNGVLEAQGQICPEFNISDLGGFHLGGYNYDRDFPPGEYVLNGPVSVFTQ